MRNSLNWKGDPFSICHPPAGAVYPHHPLFDHSRCFGYDTKGADGAADLLEVLRNSPLEKLDFRGCLEIPSTAWQKLRGRQLDQFERSKLSFVPRFANLVAMFGQFVETPCFFSRMLRAIVTAVSLTTFGNIERPKM